jgi:class 3 adenylate cyclase/predicted ATPase
MTQNGPSQKHHLDRSFRLDNHDAGKSWGVIMDLGSWLRSLGLAQYEAAFRENAINEAILPKLTAEDLKDMGVTAVGHRRVLLDAIAALRGETPPKQENAPSAAAEPANMPNRDGGGFPEAERRQLTVMFCDLVGSTALSGKLDPEDMRAVIGTYHRCCTELIERNSGFVAKYMGDGVLAYFGYPEAHEHDAERAVRAGLALVEAMPKLETDITGTSLQTRIGIATGLVVVGDLIGSGEAQERGIVGETPNLAARLQGIAAPNTVAIAEGTRRLVGSFFELEDLGPKDLKGIAGPVGVWVVLRAASVESRFEALHATGLIALVGREEESELLFRRWTRAKTGEGQVVLIAGEAGIGKSRLTAELLERLAAEPHTRLRYFCSPQHTDSALHPIIGQMERAAGLAHDDAPQARLDKLNAVLVQTSTSIEDAALFADMLSLPNDGRYPTLNLTPQQRRQSTLKALISQLEALARQSPVLMIFEDAHWIDPTSLEALGQVVDRIQSLRVLLIVTFRLEFDPPWIGRPHVNAMTINRLTQRDVSAMIDRVTGNKLLPASVRQDIIERTDGIPLFVEEMTKAVLEAEGEAQRTIAAVPSPAVPVPPSLHASLMARLDRLGPAKEMAQIGAVIGREFSHALLSAVVRKPGAELGSALDRLIAAGLLFRQGVPPHATYLFKHALVQDAAYGTLLREPRRALHARIAETLEREFTDIVESRPELLAHHCTEAGLIQKAAGLWGDAGQRSLDRSALVEAAEQLTRALDQMAALPATPELRAKRIKLQVALITPLFHVKGYTAPETKAAAEQARLLIEQAEALGEPAEDPLLLFSVLYSFWVNNYVGFIGDTVLELAAQFLALAEKQGTAVPLMIGHRLMATSSLFTGNITEGRVHCDQAITLYDPVVHRPLAARFGQDIRVAALSHRPLALWCLGYPQAALADTEHALRDAREISQAASLMYALFFAFLISFYCGDFATANAQADELVALSDQKGSQIWKAGELFLRGCLLAITGNASKAIQMITSGDAAWRSMGSTLWKPTYLSYLALAYAELGQFDRARHFIGEALTTAQVARERWCEADVYRTAGEIALMAPQPEVGKAEACFERALSVARQQQAKSWELRAAMSMARLWRDQRKRQQAHDLLAPVYGGFTEGFDTLDLKQAKALLDELAS